MFFVELTTGPDHGKIVKMVPLEEAGLDRAMTAALALLDAATAEGWADGYRLRDQQGYYVASRWAGNRG